METAPNLSPFWDKLLRMWYVKRMARSRMNGYDVLLRGDMKNLVGNTQKIKDRGVTATLDS